MHKNRINGKVYIGITNNEKRRWRADGIEYKPPKNENKNGRSFWNAIKKYGWDSFEHIVLKDGLLFEEAIEKEKEYIKQYESTNRQKGYNISNGGNGGTVYQEHPRGMKGKNQTEHQKDSHAKWASKKENNCMLNGKVVWGITHEHPRGMKGKTHSDEYKKRIRELFLGGKHPSARKVIASQNDKDLEFNCIGDCIEYYGISTTIFYNLIRSGEQFTPSSNNRWKNKQMHLIGLTIRYKN